LDHGISVAWQRVPYVEKFLELCGENTYLPDPDTL
jgi:hypothetical protein